jgi:hypothetical protein
VAQLSSTCSGSTRESQVHSNDTGRSAKALLMIASYRTQASHSDCDEQNGSSAISRTPVAPSRSKARTVAS